MAIPVIPIALVAGVVALARNIHISPMIQNVEDTLDTVDEGVSIRQSTNKDQINLSSRWKRTVRVGVNGPGIEVDASVLGRIKFRKLSS